MWSQGYFYTEGTVTINPGASIEVKGNTVLNQSINGDGFLVMNGDNPQHISGNSAQANNFKVTNSADVILNTTLRVNDTLHMQSGILYLDNEHLFLADNSVCTGNGGGFIETNGSGYIQRKIDNNGFTFHTGHGNEYFPITLTEMGIADTFRLQGWNILPNDGSITGTPVTAHVALLSYSFTDLVNGGNDLSIIMGWNDSKNAPDFAQTHAIGIVYDGSNYTELSNCPTNVNNIDPNMVSYTGINTTGTFGIGDSIYASNIPQAFIQPGDTSICAGSNITFTALPAGVSSYHWSTGDTTQTINTNTANNYYVTIIDSTGCSYTSDVVVLTVLSTPLTPVIVYNAPLLSVDSTYSSYQWFLDGNPIGGATNYSTNSIGNGSYSVVVTGANGCTVTSDEYPLTLSILDENTAHCSIYNHFDLLTINLTGDEAMQVIICDALGKIVYHQQYHANTIPLQLCKGMYVVRITGKQGEYVKKIIW